MNFDARAVAARFPEFAADAESHFAPFLQIFRHFPLEAAGNHLSEIEGPDAGRRGKNRHGFDAAHNSFGLEETGLDVDRVRQFLDRLPIPFAGWRVGHERVGAASVEYFADIRVSMHHRTRGLPPAAVCLQKHLGLAVGRRRQLGEKVERPCGIVKAARIRMVGGVLAQETPDPVRSRPQQSAHIVGGIVGPRSHGRLEFGIAHSFTVEVDGVKTAGCGIKPGLLGHFGQLEVLAHHDRRAHAAQQITIGLLEVGEARLAAGQGEVLPRLDFRDARCGRGAADPARLPIIALQQRGLEARRGRPGGGLSILIPIPDPPVNDAG